MGKVLVLYDSETGNTATMARHVVQGAEAVSGTEVRLRDVDDATVDDVRWCDGLALGSPTHLGLISWKMKRFWDRASDEIWGHVDGKIACAFSSSGGWGGGAEIASLSALVLLMNFGFLVFGIPDYVAKKFTLHYGAVTSREPREEQEIDACIRLGERLAQWVGVYADGRAELAPPPFKERKRK